LYTWPLLSCIGISFLVFFPVWWFVIPIFQCTTRDQLCIRLATIDGSQEILNRDTFPTWKKDKKKKKIINWGIYLRIYHTRTQWPREKKNHVTLSKIEKKIKIKTRPKLKRVVRGRKRYCRNDNWLYNWVGSRTHHAHTIHSSDTISVMGCAK
jgi:hypothetical protein